MVLRDHYSKGVNVMANKSKLFLTSATILAAICVSGNPAWAVSDAEFDALKQQMSMFASQLQDMQSEQKMLRSENAALKEQNQRLQSQNFELSEDLSMAIEKSEMAMQRVERSESFKIGSVSGQGDAAAMASAVEPAAGDASSAPHKDGVLIPGTDTRVKFGGYVKLDAIHDFNVSRSGSGEDFGLYAAIPLDGSDEDKKGGQTRMHARQTRLNVTATTPTEYGKLKVFVEGDFYGGGGSQNTTNANGFALRHAYGELGPYLAGQTWSNYMDLAAYPESLDFQGVTGNTLLRQGQLRYTYTPDGSDNSYSIALENPASNFASDPANPGTDSSIDEYPDLTLKARFKGNYGEYSLKGVARKIEAFNSAGDQKDSDFGYALGVSGKLNAGGKDDVRFQAAYGDGIGRYIYSLAAGSQSAGFSASADALETVEAWGGYVAYRHWWSDSLRSNFIAGTTQVLDNPSFLNPATTNEHIYSGHTNLIWSVTDKLDIGGEYIYAERETESGAEGDLHRAQFSAIYKF